MSDLITEDVALKHYDDYRPFLYAAAVLPFFYILLSDAEQMVPILGVYVICANLFVWRYFWALRATRQPLGLGFCPFVAVGAMDTGIVLLLITRADWVNTLSGIGLLFSVPFIWFMCLFRKKLVAAEENVPAGASCPAGHDKG